jgi:uncharacterized protein (DUF2164 family)
VPLGLGEFIVIINHSKEYSPMPRRNIDNPMRIKLSDERKTVLLKILTDFYREQFDEELSSYRAELLLNFFIKQIGPPIYNQAIADARAFMSEKLEDLDVEYYEPE